MSEYFTSFLVVFSEIGVVLALLTIVTIVFIVIRKAKDNSMAKDFVINLKQKEGSRKEGLSTVLQKVHDMDDSLADKTAQAMLGCEKQIYNRALKLFLGHDRESLNRLQKDVENMAGAYRKLISSAESVKVVERGDNPKLEAQLRTALKQVGAERDKVQRDLDEAMISMENMLKEYTQMYSGGGARKEGVKHIENELTMLKQKIDTNLVEVNDEDEVPTALATGEDASAPLPSTDDKDEASDLTAEKE